MKRNIYANNGAAPTFGKQRVKKYLCEQWCDSSAKNDRSGKSFRPIKNIAIALN